MPEVDLAIIGAGPAGLSTALHLLGLDPGWSERMVVLEKAVHPRQKLCAGGITRFGLRQLQALGLELQVPHVPIREARLDYRDRRICIHGEPIFAVTRRPEFDGWLAEQARRRGVRLLEQHDVQALERTPQGIRLTANGQDIRARALVGADGSTGLVRRWLGARERPPHVARLLEVVVPASGDEPEYRRRMARFDFSPLKDRLQGYYWDFPSLIAGRPYMNSGIYDSRVHAQAERAHLQPLLKDELEAFRRQAAPEAIQGHPIHWFSPWNRFSGSRVLLVGDAAGVDPLFGEGIGPALGFGRVAAVTLQRAFARGDFSFRDYRRRVLLSPVGRYLVIRWLGAKAAYRFGRRDWLMRLLWSGGRLAAAVLAPSAELPAAQPSSARALD